jgi:hypothetical protein
MWKLNGTQLLFKGNSKFFNNDRLVRNDSTKALTIKESQKGDSGDYRFVQSHN